MTYKVKKTVKGNSTTISDACVECGITHMVNDTCNCNCHKENKQSVEDILNKADSIGKIMGWDK